MAFFSLSCLPPEYIVQHLQTGHTQHWRVHRQEGPTVENLHLLGTITKHPGSYVAQQSLPTKTQAFLTLEEAALWIRQTAPASVAMLGLKAFGQRALSMLWRLDRGTRKYLDDLLLKVVQDTYTTLPNTPADARPQDQEEALASLYGIEERATTYFDQFETYKATLQRET